MAPWRVGSRPIVEGHTFELYVPGPITREQIGVVLETRSALARDVTEGVITTLAQLCAVPMPDGCTLKLRPLPMARVVATTIIE